MHRGAIRVVWAVAALGAAGGGALLAQSPRPADPTVSVAQEPTITIAPQNITAQDLLAGLANPARWLTMSGDYSAQRFSPLTQITTANAGPLAAQWTFQTGVAGKFETTPIVIDGIL